MATKMVNGVEVTMSADEEAAWQAEVDSNVAADAAYQASFGYQDDRAKAYPHITEQLDMLWHAIDNNALDQTSEFYTTLKAVKDATVLPLDKNIDSALEAIKATYEAEISSYNTEV